MKNEKKILKRWRPRIGDLYYLVGSSGLIYKFRWNESDFDKEKRLFMGVYRTRVEAFAMAKKIKDFVSEQIGRG